MRVKLSASSKHVRRPHITAHVCIHPPTSLFVRLLSAATHALPREPGTFLLDPLSAGPTRPATAVFLPGSAVPTHEGAFVAPYNRGIGSSVVGCLRKRCRRHAAFIASGILLGFMHGDHKRCNARIFLPRVNVVPKRGQLKQHRTTFLRIAALVLVLPDPVKLDCECINERIRGRDTADRKPIHVEYVS